MEEFSATLSALGGAIPDEVAKLLGVSSLESVAVKVSGGWTLKEPTSPANLTLELQKKFLSTPCVKGPGAVLWARTILHVWNISKLYSHAPVALKAGRMLVTDSNVPTSARFSAATATWTCVQVIGSRRGLTKEEKIDAAWLIVHLAAFTDDTETFAQAAASLPQTLLTLITNVGLLNLPLLRALSLLVAKTNDPLGIQTLLNPFIAQCQTLSVLKSKTVYPTLALDLIFLYANISRSLADPENVITATSLLLSSDLPNAQKIQVLLLHFEALEILGNPTALGFGIELISLEENFEAKESLMLKVAKMLHLQGDYAGAKSLAQKIVGLLNFDALILAANCAWQLNDIEAEKLLAESSNIKTLTGPAALTGALILQESDPVKALELTLESTKTLNYFDENVYSDVLQIGKLLYQLGNKEGSLTFLKEFEALSKDPSLPLGDDPTRMLPVCELLAGILLDSDAPNEAIQILETRINFLLESKDNLGNAAASAVETLYVAYARTDMLKAAGLLEKFLRYLSKDPSTPIELLLALAVRTAELHYFVGNRGKGLALISFWVRQWAKTSSPTGPIIILAELFSSMYTPDDPTNDGLQGPFPHYGILVDLLTSLRSSAEALIAQEKDGQVFILEAVTSGATPPDLKPIRAHIACILEVLHMFALLTLRKQKFSDAETKKVAQLALAEHDAGRKLPSYKILESFTI